MSDHTWRTGFTRWIEQQARDNGVVDRDIPEALLWCWSTTARTTGLDPEDIVDIARCTGASLNDVVAAYQRDHHEWTADQAVFDQPDLADLDAHLDAVARGWPSP
ncbi:hypothetical protein [Streptacidiphilus jiangxiensis]|uniref:Uncharacterized protein n=1 Tax=Streptacidiphilus jiangxiensis TaxID=235985 RepID=A0A1H7QPY8_STRJI|nr:hypothetical protein [Streptacidiphilus jiangxiensis]SEL50071.1 hypothetical protein SAMN05414137_109153 [Streptacidiphilus jiangxiensis]